MCTVGRDESAAVMLTCSEGYMLQVCLLRHLKLAIYARRGTNTNMPCAQQGHYLGYDGCDF